jgi:hypothetical protein
VSAVYVRGLAPAAMSICHSLMEAEGLAQPCNALAHLAPNDSGIYAAW